ncbi:hypothetical protein [Endozoicomonas sp. Mp262]|uniref:hypothetical protein n=1 Tax=Endozoicomonas sp. Mp262 TaxID=2919499 RepID=UPI0021D891A9
MNLTTVLTFIIISCLALLTISLIYWSLRLGITPTPTSPKVKQSLKSILPTPVHGEIHELGCGWGTLLPLLLKTYPNNNILAYERSFLPRSIAKLIGHFYYPSIKITKQDFFQADLSKAGLIVCYLYPKAMEKLASHFKNTLPDDCWVISHTFRIPGWHPVKTLKANDLYKTPLYLYRTPSCPKE